ncbi:MAG: hypothetical protein Q8936_15200 [Bacillota bacterium]|nr:hypothetical protein [Bacillota bacterium]
MGVILCGRHGRSGITGTCIHVHTAIQNKESIKTIRLRMKFDGAKFELIHWVCPICDGLYKDITSEDEFSVFLTSMKACCGGCFDEWMQFDNKDIY